MFFISILTITDDYDGDYHHHNKSSSNSILQIHNRPYYRCSLVLIRSTTLLVYMCLFVLCYRNEQWLLDSPSAVQTTAAIMALCLMTFAEYGGGLILLLPSIVQSTTNWTNLTISTTTTITATTNSDDHIPFIASTCHHHQYNNNSLHNSSSNEDNVGWWSSTSKSISISTRTASPSSHSFQDDNDDVYDENWIQTRPIFYMILCIYTLLPFPNNIYRLFCSLLIIILEIVINFSTASHHITTNRHHCSCFSYYYYDNNRTIVVVVNFDGNDIDNRMMNIISTTTTTTTSTNNNNNEVTTKSKDNNDKQLLLLEKTISIVSVSSTSLLSSESPVSEVKNTNTTITITTIININYTDIISFTADMLFYLCAALVASYVTYLLEIVNRRAFLDHRKCVESKYKLTFEKDEQERLLSSCLPRHLMKKVREDIRSRFTIYHQRHNNNNNTLSSSSDHQFTNFNTSSSFHNVNDNDYNNIGSLLFTKSNQNQENENKKLNMVEVEVRSLKKGKEEVDSNDNNNNNSNAQESINYQNGSTNNSISRPFSSLYIERHKNVTILYADIVNSMLLTQVLKSPKELVETLNELFGRFDNSAEVYNL